MKVNRILIHKKNKIILIILNHHFLKYVLLFTVIDVFISLL
jgi:hypothetical protein